MSHPTRTVFTLRAGSLGPDDLRVRRVHGREKLSEPYSFTVDFAPRNGEFLKLPELVGAEASLTLRRPDGSERQVHGMVWRAEMTGVAAGKPSYRVRLVPRLERLKCVKRSRVFQAKSLPEIVKQVLGEHGVEHRFELAGSYQPREYCVQYRESDFDFVSRLLEDLGIFYWFEQGEGSHRMVIADANGGCTDLPDGNEVPYRVPEQVGDRAEDEHLYWLERELRARPEKVQVRDYDFKRPEMALEAKSQVTGPFGTQVYEWPGGFEELREGKERARLKLEELRADAETWNGKGTCLRFFPGARFEITGHEDQSFDQKLLLVAVEHEGEQQEEAGATEAIAHGYRNTFAAVEASVPFRPPRRTKRPMALPTTALVVGPEGEEIWVDAYGRIKTRFFWDREGKSDETASCWMRVAQAWAGVAWGASYVPRVGMEVLVKFFHHDPDQPFVAGAVYNGQNRPPIELPQEKTRSTLRSNSSPRGWSGNELGFEDQKDAERFYLHAQKDEAIRVEKDKSQKVHGNESLEVTKDRSIEVQGNQQLQVEKDDSSAIGKSQTLSVAGDRATQVGGDHDETVGVAQTVTVSGNRDVRVNAASVQTVGAAEALTIGAGYAVNVAGAENIAVGGALTREVGGEQIEVVGLHREERVAQDSAAQVGGDFASQVSGRVSLSTEGDQKEEVGGGTRIEVQGSVRLNAKDIDWKSAEKVTVLVGGERMLTLEKSGSIQLSGKSVTVNGKRIALKGAQIVKRAPAAARQQAAKVKQLKDLSTTPAVVKFDLVDKDGAPIANQEFIIKYSDDTVQTGMTDDKGHALIPAPRKGSYEIILRHGKKRH